MQRLGQGLTLCGCRLVAALLVVAAVAAFGGAAGIGRTLAQDSASPETRGQVVHAASDLGRVEVHFNDDEVLDEFAYGDQSDWIALDPGTVNIRIARDRVGINDTVFNAVFPVPAGNDFYLIITDALIIGGGFDRRPLPDGTARVQVIHASADTPAIDVAAVGTNSNLAGRLAYSQTAETVEIPAGAYDAAVIEADTGAVLMTIPGATFEAGKVYELVVVGTPGDDDTPLELKVLVSDVAPSGAGTPEATPEA